MAPETLAVRIRQARGPRSLDEAEALTGVKAKQIEQYESGERKPYGPIRARLEKGYGLEPEALSDLGKSVSRTRTRGRRRTRESAPAARATLAGIIEPAGADDAQEPAPGTPTPAAMAVSVEQGPDGVTLRVQMELTIRLELPGLAEAVHVDASARGASSGGPLDTDTVMANLNAARDEHRRERGRVVVPAIARGA